MKIQKFIFIFLFIFAFSFPVFTQGKVAVNNVHVLVQADKGTETISRHIYGHFSEHLGHCIYGGYWVGEDSNIPNTRGIRNDIVQALKAIDIPNLRWPGGCFADEYHWKDGIGDPSKRPEMINTHWGGVTEDNRFGTHEFMDLCEQLGTEAYICGNVGSGSVEEMADWVEYLNFDGVSPMADLRRENGRDNAWGVKYWGVGNENWGCGGNMTAEFYADQYRRYATYSRNYGDNRLYKVAGGANASDYHWTETLMKNIPHWMMDGISLHHYTVDWSDRGAATGFAEDEYFKVLSNCLNIEKVLDKHIQIMDKYDPAKKIGLIVDEWGTWYNPEPGSNPGFLYQQNSLRDAMVAALSLNYFNDRCERIKMTNIAQTINVLQALILTDNEKMLLTPTYHVYDMYKVHQDATRLPVQVVGDEYVYEGNALPAVSVSASKDAEGKVHISIVNIDPKKDARVNLDIFGIDVSKVSGKILTSANFNDYNSFGESEKVRTADFKEFKKQKEGVVVNMPSKSIVVLEIQ